MTDRTLDPIAAQLRTERQRRQLTLPRAADLVGLEAVVIGAYERGDRTPPLDKLRTWAEGLGHKLVAVPTVNGAEAAATGAGQMRIEYAVIFGTRVIPCDSEQAAVELSGLMAGAVVVCRVVRLTGWEPVR